MNPPAIYSTEFPSLRETDTVGQATRHMLEHRVLDLPVVDASGRFLGMFRLNRLLAVVLPKAALMGYGMADLSFATDSLDQLRERFGAAQRTSVREFIVKPEHVVNPQTSPLEIALLLYKGENTLPVVAGDGDKLVGMISPRDLLAALHDEGAR